MRRAAGFLIAGFVLGAAAGLHYAPRFAPDRPASPAGAAGALVAGPYFSDDGGIEARVTAALDRSGQTVDVAMYDFTSRAIAGALLAAHRRGVRVRIVADRGQSSELHSQIADLRSAGIDVRLAAGFNGERSLMHDKFAVVDGRLAITGSFNWTVSGERYNSENEVFISDPAIAARFEAEFERLWRRAAEP